MYPVWKFPLGIQLPDLRDCKIGWQEAGVSLQDVRDDLRGRKGSGPLTTHSRASTLQEATDNVKHCKTAFLGRR